VGQENPRDMFDMHRLGTHAWHSIFHSLNRRFARRGIACFDAKTCAQIGAKSPSPSRAMNARMFARSAATGAQSCCTTCIAKALWTSANTRP